MYQLRLLEEAEDRLPSNEDDQRHDQRVESDPHGRPPLPRSLIAPGEGEEDRQRVERIPGQAQWDTVNETGWGDEGNVRAWYRFINAKKEEIES